MIKLLKEQSIIIFSLSTAMLYGFLAYGVQRYDFGIFLAIMTLLFLSYFFLLNKTITTKELKLILLFSIAFRIIFIVAIPAMSDDFYRFLWDGSLLNLGINPYDFHPDQIPSVFAEANNYQHDLFNQMNSKSYYSVYPPVLQSVFALAVYIGSGNLMATLLILHLFIILAEIGSIFLIYFLLRKLRLPLKNVLWYALNPLIILELSGNLHFEALLIFFFLLSVSLIFINKTILSAIVFAFAFAIKLWPLLFLPFLWRQIGAKKSLLFYAVFSLSVLLLFIPLYNEKFLSHYLESIQLYFQTFEFNGGIHYLIKSIGFYFSGFNIISYSGPIVGVLVFLLIMYLAFIRKRSDNFFQYWYYGFLAYIVSSSIIHPWNISLLILFAVFVPNKLPILWSFLILLSYHAYQNDGYTENNWIIAVEFIILAIYFYYELVKKNKIDSSETT